MMSKHSVLIIEDNSSMMRGLKDNFSSRGYQVSSAMDGETGLNMALNTQPDLIILDIMLPKINGYEICKRVRESEQDMPIIMLTAKGQQDDIIRGLNLGADDYMSKPFSIKELLARANAFMRRRQHSAPEDYHFGDYLLNVTSRTLHKNEQEIRLTPKEFSLLSLFIKRIGHALTRDTILNQVWHSNLLTTSRSVDRCVNTLRKKIEPNPDKPTYIKSIRDIGYRFENEIL